MLKRFLHKLFNIVKYTKKIPIIITITLLCIIAFILLTVTNYYWGSSNEFHTDAIKALQTALIAGAFVTPITQIISNEIIKVTKKDKKLREYGIHNIGTGIYSYDDETELFGSRFEGVPSEIDLMFLSGNGFLSKYKQRLIDLIKKGCNIRILLIRPLYNGIPNEFIIRYGEICEPQNKSLAYQICKETLPIIEEIENATKNARGSIELRTYVDEFRTNQRFAIYQENVSEENANFKIKHIKCHINVQAGRTIAQDFSLLLKGTIHSDDLSKGDLENNNIMYNSMLGFNFIWDKYPNSRPKPQDCLPFERLWENDNT